MMYKLVYTLADLEDITGIPDREMIDDEQLLDLIHSGNVQVNVMHSETGNTSCFITRKVFPKSDGWRPPRKKK